ncbi:MAG: hypothetical protein QOI37_997 [Chloroflexota bacterium]|nr:hypothetical protein [Chloroflexota bacterium]
MGYWVGSLALIVFGVVAMFSIGRPFLLVGLAMLVLGRLRSRPVMFWPPLAAVIAYNVGYWAVAPLYCTATEAAGETSTTTCSSLLGIGYSGSGIYNPSLDPANLAGLLFAAIALVVVLAVMLRHGRRTKTPA